MKSFRQNNESLIKEEIRDLQNELKQKERKNRLLRSISHVIATIRDKKDLIDKVRAALRTELHFADIAITT